MGTLFNVKIFVLAFFLFSALGYSSAQDKGDSGLNNGDFAHIDDPSSDTPSRGVGADSAGETAGGESPSSKDEGSAEASPRKPRRTSDYAEEDSKDYFDAGYIRKAAFYDLPFLDIEPSELSEYEKDKLISSLKRRLSVYNAAIKRIELKIEEVGGEKYSSKERSNGAKPSPNKDVRMPVEINGKEYDAINAILVATSKDSSATAFFANIKNRNFIVTNMHVMQSESEVNFRTFNGVEIKMPKTGFFSKGKDVFILPVSSIPEGCIALPIEEDISKNLSVFDKLVICGNSMGGGTLVHIMGEVVAVGPDIVEHNCNAQKGHSGSPIYSRKTKNIVGVLSHSIEFSYFEKGKKLGKNPEENRMLGSRDFGYRIDNIKDWTQIKTDKLIELSTNLKDFKQKYTCLANAIHQNSYSRSSNYRDLNKIITLFRSKNKGSSVAYKEAKIEFLKDVKNLIGYEIISMKNKKLDDVFPSATYLLDAFEQLQNDCGALIKNEL
ncbi:MAG: trypsin-like peptidase domain-containing protein [Opitutales bacterium]|nr:trypsin-like peptidase domain-containing protein [Opitutales bacterium]